MSVWWGDTRDQIIVHIAINLTRASFFSLSLFHLHLVSCKVVDFLFHPHLPSPPTFQWIICSARLTFYLRSFYFFPSHLNCIQVFGRKIKSTVLICFISCSKWSGSSKFLLSDWDLVRWWSESLSSWCKMISRESISQLHEYHMIIASVDWQVDFTCIQSSLMMLINHSIDCNLHESLISDWCRLYSSL